MNVRLREWLAYKIAPWTYVPYREAREEAFRDLAEIAYASRNAVWTSPRTLVKTALERARWGEVSELDSLVETAIDLRAQIAGLEKLVSYHIDNGIAWKRRAIAAEKTLRRQGGDASGSLPSPTAGDTKTETSAPMNERNPE